MNGTQTCNQLLASEAWFTPYIATLWPKTPFMNCHISGYPSLNIYKIYLGFFAVAILSTFHGQEINELLWLLPFTGCYLVTKYVTLRRNKAWKLYKHIHVTTSFSSVLQEKVTLKITAATKAIMMVIVIVAIEWTLLVRTMDIGSIPCVHPNGSYLELTDRLESK